MQRLIWDLLYSLLKVLLICRLENCDDLIEFNTTPFDFFFNDVTAKAVTLFTLLSALSYGCTFWNSVGVSSVEYEYNHVY